MLSSAACCYLEPREVLSSVVVVPCCVALPVVTIYFGTYEDVIRAELVVVMRVAP